MYKSYVCDVSNTVLSSLLAPQRGMWIECNTTQARALRAFPARHSEIACSLGLQVPFRLHRAASPLEDVLAGYETQVTGM